MTCMNNETCIYQYDWLEYNIIIRDVVIVIINCNWLQLITFPQVIVMVVEIEIF